MKKTLTIITLLTIVTAVTMTNCNKNKPDNWHTLKKLHKTYKNGEISECSYNDETVYSAAINAYDAGNAVYDKDGKQIGTCNYNSGSVDAICGQLQGCEVIYRVDNNIWGQPAVDKYGLGN